MGTSRQVLGGWVGTVLIVHTKGGRGGRTRAELPLTTYEGDDVEMRSRRRSGMSAAAVLTAAMVVTGCAADDAAPAATADPDTSTSAEPQTPVLIPAAPGEPDPGSYRTTPWSFTDKTVTSLDQGSIVESERLAEFVALPTEIDPGLSAAWEQRTFPIPDPYTLDQAFSGHTTDAMVSVDEDHGFYAGYASGRRAVDSDREIIHAVLQFPDTESARAAAQTLHQDIFTRETKFAQPDEYEYPIAALPGSLISAQNYDHAIAGQALTAYGRHLIYTKVFAPLDDREWFDRTLTTAVDVQRPLLDRFPVTEPEDLANLEHDHDDVLILTISDGEPDETKPHLYAVLGPRGAAHQAVDQVGLLEAMTKSGTTHLAVGGTNLYKSSTTDGAEILFDLLPGLIRSGAGVSTSIAAAAGPAGVPNTRCFDVVTTAEVYAQCVVLHGQYVGEILGDDLRDAHQLTAAQYLTLDSAAAEK